MGAWEELDITIGSEFDLTGLDEIIEECNSDSDFADIFAPAIEQAELWKTAIEKGNQQGLDVVAGKIVSKEQTEILDVGKHPYSQGILGTSIVAEKDGDYRIIGTTINHIYPMSVEYGADIYPVNASVLRVHESQVIDWNGKPDKEGYYYFKEAHIEAKPFVQPAFEETPKMVEDDEYGVFRSVCDKMTQAIQK